MKKKAPIIAIDGPAGAGKSTVARLVARRLGFLYIDTGAMYRALTWKALARGIAPDDAGKIVPLARATRLELAPKRDGSVQVFADGREITRQIRSQQVTGNVNTVASIPGVRVIMRRLQRALAKGGGVVMEGRDIGTAVFPKAEYKFYLNASIAERARRRHAELRAKGERVSLESIRKAIRTRDWKDRHRRVSPLTRAADAVVIDSTALTIPQTVEAILQYIGCKR